MFSTLALAHLSFDGFNLETVVGHARQRRDHPRQHAQFKNEYQSSSKY
ncbi:MAG: hypothetical protein LBQ32_01800 [Burkholderiaceae bacterium]|nr:hypothetical protein [Burkholderiaceae bacterium]